MNDETTEPITSGPEPEKKGNSMMIIGVIVVILLAGAGFFLLKGNTPSGSEPQSGNTGEVGLESSPKAAEVEGTTDTVSSDQVETITLEAGSFYYKPNEIKVKKGEKVKIVMTSKDMMHDFNIDELGVKLAVTKSGETNSVEFTPDKTGTFEFYCSVGQHRKNGQVG